jgi:hypothetical protein
MGGGFVAALTSFSFSWGPCGPSSPLALVLLFGGLLTFLFGFGLFSTGLIRNLIQRVRNS